MSASTALARRPLILELGCGSTKRLAESIGVDVRYFPGVDVVGDALEVLRSLPDGSVRAIRSEHFLEHISHAEHLVRESARVLEPGGEFRAVVPHFSNPHFYSDPTHRNIFGLYTFSYWVASVPWTRRTPQYGEPIALSLVEARYHFKSSRPFYGRHAIKRLLGSWVNTSRWTQEFYEENLTWLMPAYELEYVLRKP
jgi:ubiquinone/menaquinone biosynthesis C-methylase UbiE